MNRRLSEREIALAASGWIVRNNRGLTAAEQDEFSSWLAADPRHGEWWAKRRRMGKPLNLLRLVKASTTFEGAARYAAWKIERHTGLPLEVTPLNERFPLLAAPRVLWALWRHRRSQKNA